MKQILITILIILGSAGFVFAGEITWSDKVQSDGVLPLNDNEKVSYSDMNEVKNAVNDNYEQLSGMSMGGCSSYDCTAQEILQNQTIDFGSCDFDFDQCNLNFPPDGWFFDYSNTTDPSISGQLNFDANATGFEDGTLCIKDDDELKCFMAFGSGDETLESGDDKKVVRYRWGGGEGYFELVDDKESIGIACSDETTDLTTGAVKVTFRMPHALTLTEVRANVNTAPVGSTIIVDINEDGTTVLSTKLSIDASEKTSTTAATAAVISDSALADDAEITIDIDQIGSTTAGKGLKIWLIGTK